MMQIVKKKKVRLLNWLISAFDIFISHVFQFLKRLLVSLELAMTGWHHHQNSGGEKYLLILAIWLCGFLFFFSWGPPASTGSEILFRCITMPFHSRNCINAVLNHSLKSKWVESAFHYTRAWILQLPLSSGKPECFAILVVELDIKSLLSLKGALQVAWLLLWSPLALDTVICLQFASVACKAWQK